MLFVLSQEHAGQGYSTELRWGLLRKCLDTVTRKGGPAIASHIDQVSCWAILTSSRPDAALPEWLLQRVAQCDTSAAPLVKMYCQLGRLEDAVSLVSAMLRNQRTMVLITAARVVLDALQRRQQSDKSTGMRQQEALAAMVATVEAVVDSSSLSISLKI